MFLTVFFQEINRFCHWLMVAKKTHVVCQLFCSGGWLTTEGENVFTSNKSISTGGSIRFHVKWKRANINISRRIRKRKRFNPRVYAYVGPFSHWHKCCYAVMPMLMSLVKTWRERASKATLNNAFKDLTAQNRTLWNARVSDFTQSENDICCLFRTKPKPTVNGLTCVFPRLTVLVAGAGKGSTFPVQGAGFTLGQFLLSPDSLILLLAFPVIAFGLWFRFSTFKKTQNYSENKKQIHVHCSSRFDLRRAALLKKVTGTTANNELLILSEIGWPLWSKLGYGLSTTMFNRVEL